MTIFFTKKLLKQRNQNHTPTPRSFNKTCLQHKVLTKCCHPVAFSGPALVHRHTRASDPAGTTKKTPTGKYVGVLFCVFFTETAFFRPIALVLRWSGPS